MTEGIKKFINEEELKLKVLVSHSDRMCLLGSIINLKLELRKIGNNDVNIYLDLKSFIKENVHAIDEREFEYDDINKSFISNIIKHLPIRQRLRILKYLKKEITSHGYTDTLNWCINEIRNIEYLISFEDRDYFKWITYKIAASPLNIVFFILVIILFCSAVLLPAPTDKMATFSMVYDTYCNSYIGNHLLNVICIILGSAKDGKVVPISPVGVIGIVVGKIILIIIVVNFLIKELERRMDL
jgi:hypothetical protein